MAKPTAFVTGCSSGGIGEAIALEFASQGYHVFATVRNKSKAESLSGNKSITVVEMDVTSTESVSAAVKRVCVASGCDQDTFKLDVLVNNAGLGSAAPLLEQDPAELRKVFDANVFGLVATTQAFKMPLVRAKGKILNVASVGGVLPNPFIGAYCGSKAAVAMLSETLGLELAPFGVGVITLMLGTVKSRFHVNDSWSSLSAESLWKPFEESFLKAAKGGYSPPGQDAGVLARGLVRDIKTNTTGYVWRGTTASICRIMVTFLPGGWVVCSLGTHRCCGNG